MANIKVQNLVNHSISGAELFKDSESFMQELDEGDLLATNGGTGFICSAIVFVVLTYFSTAE